MAESCTDLQSCEVRISVGPGASGRPQVQCVKCGQWWDVRVSESRRSLSGIPAQSLFEKQLDDLTRHLTGEGADQ